MTCFETLATNAAVLLLHAGALMPFCHTPCVVFCVPHECRGAPPPHQYEHTGHFKTSKFNAGHEGESSASKLTSLDRPGGWQIKRLSPHIPLPLSSPHVDGVVLTMLQRMFNNFTSRCQMADYRLVQMWSRARHLLVNK